jgi:flagellar basal body-associated protein FliL
MEEEKNIVPEQKKEEPKHKGNGLLVTILLILVLAMAGYIVYDKVIRKDNPEEQIEEKEKQEENKEEKQEQETEKEQEKEEPKEEKFNLDNLAGKTFKTKDGKKKLEILSKKDSKAVNEAKKYEFIDLNGDFDYFGYYNGVLFTIYKNSDLNSNNPKYVVLGGREKGNVPQCNETHEFIINTEDNSLVNLKYTPSDGGGYHYIVSKYGDNYYFSEGGCAMHFMSENVYDEKLNRIGDVILGSEKDNFYVTNNGYVVKYDKNAKVLKQTTKKYKADNIYNDQETESGMPIVTSNNLYFIYHDNDKEDSDFILVDVMNDKEFVLASSSDYIMNKFSIDKTNSLISISFELNTEMCKKCDGDKLISYTYDVVNKSITKN